MTTHKKYVLSYCSGATGDGWTHEYDSLKEFEGFVKKMRHEFTAYVTVWDNELKDFIFWKDVLKCKPDIDMLSDILRDMRRKTKQRAGF